MQKIIAERGSLTMDEILSLSHEMRFVPVIPGIEVTLLFASRETGRWTVIFRCQKDSFFPRHKHYAAGEYYVIRGAMAYRVGTAPAGSYGYEPLGVIHDRTDFLEDTELLFTNFGPVAFLDEEERITGVLDVEFFEALCASPAQPGQGAE